MATERTCAFWADEYCELDDKQCLKKCRRYVRSRAGLTLKDHYDIFLRRRERRSDLLLRWIPILIASISLAVAVASNLEKIRSAFAGAPPSDVTRHK